MSGKQQLNGLLFRCAKAHSEKDVQVIVEAYFDEIGWRQPNDREQLGVTVVECGDCCAVAADCVVVIWKADR